MILLVMLSTRAYAFAFARHQRRFFDLSESKNLINVFCLLLIFNKNLINISDWSYFQNCYCLF